MGFNIMINFNLPYFSTNPREFWSRWHISLSSWIRDYLYISLGGNRNGNLLMYRNLLIVMLIAGLWHGAAWTYVIWGAYHAALLIGHRLLTPVLNMIQIKNIILAKIFFIIRVLTFFHLVCIGWLFFRANSWKSPSSPALLAVSPLHFSFFPRIANFMFAFLSRVTIVFAIF